jgi:hypothetical protein
MQYVQYQGYNTGRGLSPAIWGNCPVEKYSKLSSDGIFKCYDFDGIATLPVDAYDCVIDSSDDNHTFSLVSGSTETAAYGILRNTLATDDNEEGWIQIPAALPLIIGSTTEAQKSLWYEARVRVSSVADDVMAIAVGLSTLIAAGDDVVQVDNTGVMADISFLGFRSVHTNSGTTGTNAVLGEVYRLGGQTAAVVRATAQTMVASTWYKLGLRFNIETHTVDYFVDGVLKDTVASSTVEASTFPNDVVLHPTFAVKTGTTTGGTFDIDWVAVGRTW